MLLPPRAPHFDAALRDAREGSPKGRATAALVLGQPPVGREREARIALAKLVKDPDGDVRFSAMASLGRIGDDTVLDVIVQGLEDTEPSVREAAVVAIGRIGGPTAHAALRRAAASEHGEVRFQAAPALIELLGEDARPEVVVLLADERASVRANTARALAGLPFHAATAMRLSRMLDDEDPEARVEAALALAAGGDERGAPVLRAALKSSRIDEEQAFTIMDALGRLGDQASIGLLAGLATSMLRSRAVKAAAAAALARLNDPRGARLLRPYLVGFRGDLREYVLGVVAALALKELAPDVILLISKPRGTSLESIAEAISALAPLDDAMRAAKADAERRGGPLADAIRAAERERARERAAEPEGDDD